MKNRLTAVAVILSLAGVAAVLLQKGDVEAAHTGGGGIIERTRDGSGPCAGGIARERC